MQHHAELPVTHWFEEIADHVGAAYLRYSFTRGTANEVSFLIDEMGLAPGMRVLDVGCGPGRHAHELGGRGFEVVGVDISRTFIDVARRRSTPGVSFAVADARTLVFDSEFDAVISLCQGGFGLSGGAGAGPTRPDADADVVAGMAAALRPGGRLGLSAFSAYFQVRFLEDGDTFDVCAGVNHERTMVRNEAGEEVERDLWTTCFTPRELRLLCSGSGLDVDQLWSVTPGKYRPRPPNLDEPEFFVVATRR
ncbi:MAG: methyltransferase domain-containing protein [Actinobacteria bacterium]|nr:methyltransferase domain-containing protein [Actinomycetota bacterium]